MKDNSRHQIHQMRAASAALIGLFAALMAAGAQLRIPGPVVPFTAQVFFCLMSGILLGACRAAAAQSLYLALGLIGLPVFSGGGGLGYVTQPSFGFLLGFLLAAPAVGGMSRLLMRKRGRLSFLGALLSGFTGLCIIDMMGASYWLLLRTLYFGESVSVWTAFAALVLPYLLTDGVWCVVTALIAPRIRRAVSPYLFTR